MVIMSFEGHVHYNVSTVDLLSTPHQSHHYNEVLNTMNMGDTEAGVTVEVMDVNGTVVSRAYNTTTGVLHIDDVHLWWPHTMSQHGSPYLYTLKVELLSNCYIITYSRIAS